MPEKPIKRRWQFGLRSLFAVTTVMAIAAWIGPLSVDVAAWGMMGCLLWTLMGVRREYSNTDNPYGLPR